MKFSYHSERPENIQCSFLDTTDSIVEETIENLKINVQLGNKFLKPNSPIKNADDINQNMIKEHQNSEKKTEFSSNEIIQEESDSLSSNSICDKLNNSLKKNHENEKTTDINVYIRSNFSELEKSDSSNLFIEPKLDKMEDSFDEINETNDEINDEIIYPEPEERQLSILENPFEIEDVKKELPMRGLKAILDYERFNINDENKELRICIVQNFKNFRESLNGDYFKVNDIYTLMIIYS